MIAYLAGISIPAFLPDLYWVLWLMLAACMGLLLPWLRRHMAFLLPGLLVASLFGAWQLYHRLDLAQLDVTLTGTVADIPEQRSGRLVLLLDLERIDSALPAAQRLRRVKLSYYDPELRLRSGDRVELVARLRSPRGLLNPDAFDIERRYLTQGVDARGYVRELISIQSEGSSWRQWLHDRLQTEFEPSVAATLVAVVLGVRHHLSDDQWQGLRVTGTAHLMVVSGLHIAVCGGLGWLLGQGIAAFAGRFIKVRSTLRYSPLILAFGLATGYAWLAGWGLPVQRAWLMLIIFLLGSWRLLELTAWQRWRIALTLVLTLQPLAILEAGTWLSFAAVALIITATAVHQGRSLNWSRIPAGWVRVQLALFVGMLPLMVFYFQQFNPLAIPVNLIAVPLVSAAIWCLPLWLPLALMWELPLRLLEAAITVFWQALSWAASVPGLVMPVIKPEWSLMIPAVLLVIPVLLPLGWLYRLLCMAAFLPLIWALPKRPDDGEYNVWLFDVGQGQAIFVETASETLLFDTGPGYRGGGSAMPYAVLPYLKARNIDRLDTLVLSHDDLDHSGGYSTLKQAVVIDQLLAGEPEQRADSEHCGGVGWRRSGVSFTMMTAYEGRDTHRASNERSCVMSVSNGVCSLLVTGDLGVSGEYRLLSAGRIEPHTWLVAGHHGSRDSTAAALLKHVQPQHVLVSAGYANRFGHPHQAVLERIERQGVTWFNTARAGAIKLSASADSCSLQQLRVSKKRYWTAG